MSLVGDLVATLSMNTAGFTAGARRATSETNTLANAITGRLKSLGSGIASSLAGMFHPVTAAITGALSGAFALNNMIDAAREAQRAEARLSSVLTATGHAAGFTKQQLQDYAAQLQQTTNFEDDATISATALLAMHKNIGGQVFKDGIRLSQDLAEAMGTDLDSAVRLVGKSLADPAKGLSALSKAGVDFTAAEKEKIKALVESNDLLSAQQIILAKLEETVGGTAAATSEPIKQLTNDLGNLGEAMGTPLLNAINNTIVGLKSYKAEVIAVATATRQALAKLPAWMSPLGPLARGGDSDIFKQMPKFQTGKRPKGLSIRDEDSEEDDKKGEATPRNEFMPEFWAGWKNRELEKQKEEKKKEEEIRRTSDLPSSLTAALQGSQEAAEIMTRGVGGTKSLEAIASKQLAVQQQTLAAVKANNGQQQLQPLSLGT